MSSKCEKPDSSNVTRRDLKLPIGPWSKYLVYGIHGLSVKIFTALLDHSIEELEVLLAEVRKNVKSRKAHCYMPV